MSNKVELEFCKRTDSRYKEIRDRHYIPNNGTHGQQIHFLIHYKGEIVGIISGASSVYGVGAREYRIYFGVSWDWIYFFIISIGAPPVVKTK